MTRSSNNANSADPNLTPLLDLVFQLITFFMLVINFKSAAIDQSIQLPVVGSARPAEAGGQSEVLVLNLDASGVVSVGGEKRELSQYLAREAELSRQLAGQHQRDLQTGDDVPIAVVIRADKATEFTDVNRTLLMCQRYGFRKVSLKVLDK